MEKQPKIAMTKTSKRIQSMIDQSLVVQKTIHTKRFRRLNNNIQNNQKKFFKLLGLVTLVLATLWILKFLLSVWTIGFAISLSDSGLWPVLFLIIHTLILWFFVMIYFITWMGIIRKKAHTLYYSHILFMTALLILVSNIISMFIWESFMIYNGRWAFLDLLLAYIIMIVVIENKEHFHK